MGLVTKGIINYNSENYDTHKYVRVLPIKNSGNEIKIIFSKNAPNPDNDYMGMLPTYAIRITEVGGIYGSFHVIFINFHRQLHSLEWEKHTDIPLKENGNKLKR
ncbi:MAG: hypothetical protein PHG03_03500 [Bacilli bacterium]|nr:hypothetical protein [Bacilli bacterium]MDD4795607.1 hypothetical protein [Bacilli bacterium]